MTPIALRKLTRLAPLKRELDPVETALRAEIATLQTKRLAATLRRAYAGA